jgi:hypothetical protein
LRNRRAIVTKTLGSALALAAMVFHGGQTCVAQVDAWERVKLIDTGRKVTISLQNGKSVSGTMQAWTPEWVSVLQRGNVTQLARSDVTRVVMLTGMSRARRAGWAALIAGAAGAGLMGAACAGTDGGCEAPGAMVAGGAILFGGIAAGVAALIPQAKETIYRADAIPARGDPLADR